MWFSLKNDNLDFKMKFLKFLGIRSKYTLQVKLHYHVMVSRVDPIWLDIIWIMDFQLYYDEQLGRWVDKNAPDEGENKPPPPPMIPKSKF